MFRKILAAGVLAASIVGVTATAASADTASIPAPVGGTISLTVADVQYGQFGGCVNTPVTVAIATSNDYAYYDWEYDTTYSGPSSWPDTGYGYGYYSGTFAESFLICPSFDQPGAYTGTLTVKFYNDYGYLITTATATDPFTVSAYVPPAPPAPPAPAPVTPTALPAWDVSGTAKIAEVNTAKAQVKMKANVKPANTTQGQRLTWTVFLDGKQVKKYVQDAGERNTYTSKALKDGKHQIVVKANGVKKASKTLTI